MNESQHIEWKQRWRDEFLESIGLETVHESGRMTTQKTTQEIQKTTQETTQKRMIRHVGPTKKGYWEILEDNDE